MRQRVWSVVAVLGLLAMLLTLGACSGKPEISGDQLLVNGGFEGGVTERYEPKNWDLDHYNKSAIPPPEVDVDATITFSGNGSLRLKVATEGGDDVRMVQRVSVKAGRYYKISGYVRGKSQPVEPDGDKNGGFGFSIKDTWASTPRLSDTNGEWERLELYVKTIKGQTTMDVCARLGYYGDVGVGEAWFDELSVTEIARDDIPDAAEVKELTPLSGGSSSSSNEPKEKSPNPLATKGAMIVFIIAGIIYVTLAVVYVFRPGGKRKLDNSILWIGLAAALLIRLPIAATNLGYATDMSCWYGWGARILDSGPFAFYKEGFCDYPPLYMWILSIPTLISRWFDTNAAINQVLFRMPAMLADIALAYGAYRLARKRMSETNSILVALFVAFNPLLLYCSSVWGQIESLFLVPLLLSMLMVGKKKFWQSGIWFGVAMLLKPQALVFIPVMLLPLIYPFTQKGENYGKAAINLLVSIGVAAAVVYVGCLPAAIGTGDYLFPYHLYTKSVQTYDYASLNALNFFSLIGMNGKKGSDIWFAGLSSGTIGMVMGIGGGVGISALYYFLKKKKGGSLWMAAALLGATFCLFSSNVHERYLLPSIILMVVAFIRRPDKRLFVVASGFAAIMTLNLLQVLEMTWIPSNDGLLLVESALAMLLYALLVWTAFDGNKFWLMAKEPKEERPYAASASPGANGARAGAAVGTAGGKAGVLGGMSPTQANKKARLMVRLEPHKNKNPFTRLDVIFIVVVMALYSVVGFWSLGDTKAAQTMWDPAQYQEGAILELDREYSLDTFWFFPEIPTGKIEISFSTDGVTYTDPVFVNLKYPDLQTADAPEKGAQYVFTWLKTNRIQRTRAKYVKISKTAGTMRLLEVGFTETDTGEKVQFASATDIASSTDHITADARKLIDEQDCFYGIMSQDYRHGAYFDEVYHARTAYEQINGIHIYETTHPPLGKVIMGWGVKIFGMTPFGWRFAGTLVGVLMLPVVYLLARALFKDSKWALLAMFLVAVDGLHMVQTRLATIDSYGTFFTLLMYYFMWLYLQRSAVTNRLRNALIPLALSGIFFGIGAASKWTCIYAGGGLAVIFFYSIFRRIMEYVESKRMLAAKKGTLTPAETERLQWVVNKTGLYVLMLFAWCGIFFVMVPIGIYCLSYAQILAVDGGGFRTIWNMQKSMLSYHGGMEATGAFSSSKWYTWPAMYRPYYYYSYSVGQKVGGMGSLGNLPLWYAANAGTLLVLVEWLRRSVVIFSEWIQGIDTTARRKNRTMSALGFLLLAFAAQYLPWTVIGRDTYLYHYFPSLMFTILMLVGALKLLHKQYPRTIKGVTIGLCVVFLATFIFFLPAFTGLPISPEYSKMLRWLPSWFFYPGWSWNG